MGSPVALILALLVACGGGQKQRPVPSSLLPEFGEPEIRHVEKRGDISLQITVADRHHTSPLVVTVRLSGGDFEKTEFTEPDGTFAFRSLAPGDYDLQLVYLEAMLSRKLRVGSEVTTQVSVDLDHIVVHSRPD